jgi:hypothetical protein
VAVRQRVHPIRQRESGIGSARLFESLPGRVVLEAVKECDAANERLLCRGVSGVREYDGTKCRRARMAGDMGFVLRKRSTRTRHCGDQ